MIITKYLTRETFSNQIAIVLILLVVFFCQKLIMIISETVNGKIPTDLILILLSLSIPEMAQFILPLSLLQGLLLTLSKLYIDNEIIVMHACGLSKNVLIKTAIIMAIFTSILSLINIIWISPLSFYYQDKMMEKSKANFNIAAITQGQFQQTYTNKFVVFIEKIQNNYFYNVFLVQLYSGNNVHPLVVLAKTGQLLPLNDGSHIIKLNNGTIFDLSKTVKDFRITNFRNYQAIIKYQNVIQSSDKIEQIDMLKLWNMSTNLARAEFHWRNTLIFSNFIMALMALPLSKINSRHERLLSIIMAMMLYLIFFLLQTSIKFNARKGKINPIFWNWVVNCSYLIVAMLMNIQDIILIRRIRSFLFLKQ